MYLYRYPTDRVLKHYLPLYDIVGEKRMYLHYYFPEQMSNNKSLRSDIGRDGEGVFLPRKQNYLFTMTVHPTR